MADDKDEDSRKEEAGRMNSKRKTAWELFFRRVMSELFVPGARILDVGGGLRVDQKRGNVTDPNRAWIKPLLERVTYEVMDPVPTYHPDFVGDVKDIPRPDASFDAVICLAVLEHVDKPWLAMDEMYRVLRPGGKLFMYVPFLCPYHAMPGYYGDYFRYTEDGIHSLCAAFERVEIVPVRGPVETLVHMLPGRIAFKSLRRIARFMDARRSSSGKQVSGYNVLAVKSR
jgi:ubiquinone/menaquinone biosynthesis C-methylase UbiE